MKQKILILGATGMIGHKLFIELAKQPNLDVHATSRSTKDLDKFFDSELVPKIIHNIDVNNFAAIASLLLKMRPDAVINCIGITKQLAKEDDPLETIEINSAFPHRLAHKCREIDAKMIQLATDCIFSGSSGNYSENDQSDATDLYGRSKFLGEVYYPHCLTIRTSFIGHEIETSFGLLEWFLSQEDQTKGFTKAIYSGIPSVLVAKIFVENILPNPKLSGLYHVSSEPITKYELISLIAKAYSKKIKIIPDDKTKIDRSLNSDRFRRETGYKPQSWPEMIETMHKDFLSCRYKNGHTGKK